MNIETVVFFMTLLSGVVLLNLVITFKWLRSERTNAEFLAMNYKLPVGVAAPVFSAKNLSGKNVDLNSFSGQPLLLAFVSAACDECRAHMPSFITLFGKAQRVGVSLFLVSMDSHIKTQAFKREFNIPINILIPEPSAVKALNPHRSTPFYCYIDEQGLIQASGTVGNAEWHYLLEDWDNRQANAHFSRFT